MQDYYELKNRINETKKEKFEIIKEGSSFTLGNQTELKNVVEKAESEDSLNLKILTQ